MNGCGTDVSLGCGAEACGLDQDHEILRQGWRFLQCEKCGTLRIPPACLVHHRVDADPVGKLPATMRVLFAMRLAWLTAFFPALGKPETRILDIGCGDGQFLEYLAGRGYKNAVGIEPDPARAEHARARGARVYDSLEAAQQAAGADVFDVMTLWHVLEHLEHPAGLIRAYVERLAPKGVFLLSVPNHESAQTRLFGRWSAFPDYGRHLWFHSPALVDWTQELLPDCKVRRVRDLNFEYEIFGWTDTLASALRRQQNFIHRTLKKGQAGAGEKVAALGTAACLLPFATLASALSLGTGRGSTITVAIERG